MAETVLTDDLLPCPFCGGPALFGQDGEGAQGVGCRDCGAGTRAFYPLKDDARHLAVEAWNRRAEGPRIATLTAERDAALADARRYRLLRQRVFKDGGSFAIDVPGYDDFAAGDLCEGFDTAIDAIDANAHGGSRDTQ